MRLKIFQIIELFTDQNLNIFIFFLLHFLFGCY